MTLNLFDRTDLRVVIASALRPTPNLRDGAPSGLSPKPPLALAALANCLAPRRSRFQSIASSRSSKRIRALVPLSGFPREPVAEP
jgi:hypothetical protein